MQKDQRRYPRFEAAIACTLKLRDGPLRLITSDVSRHGAFLRTDAPRPERELIQIHFELPTGGIDAMCMVVRVYPVARPGPRGPGMGVDFFAISKDAKDLWDAWVSDVKIRGYESGAASATPPLPALPPTLPTPPPRAPVERKHVRQRACFLVRLADRSRLREFLTTDVSHGGMFLKTPVLKKEGDLVELILVHPETQEEFHLGGSVVRVVASDDKRRAGLGIRFDPLTSELLFGLTQFIETGLDALDAQRGPDEERVVALRQAAADAPDSAGARLLMGLALLEKGEPEGAVNVLVEALVLAPDHAGVHEALAQGYRALHDDARAHAHARVASALASVRAPLSAAS